MRMTVTSFSGQYGVYNDDEETPLEQTLIANVVSMLEVPTIANVVVESSEGWTLTLNREEIGGRITAVQTDTDGKIIGQGVAGIPGVHDLPEEDSLADSLFAAEIPGYGGSLLN